MNPQTATKPAISLVIAIALATAACENLTPGQNAALAGTAAGLAVGIPLAVSGVNPAVTIPVTAGAVVLAAAGTYLLTKHEADNRQRKIAEQRARIYMARQEQLQNQNAAAGASSRYVAIRTDPLPGASSSNAVMIFDRQSNQLVGNRVYELSREPAVGQVVTVDGYRATYVGSGN